MKCIYGFIASFIISTLLSYLFPLIHVDNAVLSSLYTVSGIMFSIGMSLLVTSNTTGVENDKIRNNIRENVILLRRNFILSFLLSTILYMSVFIFGKEEKNPYIQCPFINYTLILSLFILYTIAYYIFNFVSLQKLNNDIEDQIRKEKRAL